MDATCDYILPSPVGLLGLNISSKGIQRLFYLKAKIEPRLPQTGIAAEVQRQLTQYFQLLRTQFDLPMDIQGTNYQMRVWNEIAKIPYGKSQTYGDIAQTINSGPRAVGNACRNNPVLIIVPCHRVVKKGALGGYCGSTAGKEIQQKDWLLRHETEVLMANE